MISNTAQTNTFVEGMNLDTDLTFLKDSQYRYAENVRVVTNENGTSGILQNIEGVRDYTTYIPSNQTIIGTTTVNNIGVVITVDSSGRNRIYTLTNLDQDNPTLTCKAQGYLGLCQDLSTTPNVSIIGNYETDTNVKIYFTDGNSSIKVLNIADNRYEAGSDLVDSNGNIINVLALDITPGCNIAPFELVSMSIGSLPVGMVQYCYQLFNLHEQETTLSPLSEMVHLTTSSSNVGSQYYEGAYAGNSSNKACHLRAPLFTKDFSKCRIISIRYTENNQNPTIVIVDEINIDPTQDYINYTDTGNSYMGEISIEEFNNLVGYQFAPKTIAKKDNRLFAANIKEETWNPEYDARSYRANSSGTVLLQSSDSTRNLSFSFSRLNSSIVPEDHDCINPFNYAVFADTLDSDKYIYNSDGKLGGTGINISYNFITANIRLSEDQDDYRADNNCSMNVEPANIRGRQCTNVGYSTTVDVNFSNGYEYHIPNYADPNIDARFKGYQRDEIYRFGIIFYNNKSLPSPVYWIGDIRMPHATQVPPFVYEDNALYGKALGIKFTVKNAPEGAVAYEIVRCDRTESDRTIIMNVIGSQLYEYNILDEESDRPGTGDVISNSLEMRPPVFFSNDYGRNLIIRTPGYGDSVQGRISVSDAVTNYLRLVSPEICLQKENIESIFTDTYLEYIGNCFSLIENKFPLSGSSVDLSKDPSVNFSTASRVLQSDGTIKRVIQDLYCQNGDGVNELILNLPDNNGNEEVFYNAHIAKYYYPYYRDTSYSNNSITNVKYPLDIPYNTYNQGIAAYKVNIGNRTYTNYAMSNFNNSDQQIACGPAGPCVVVYMQNNSTSYAVHPPSFGYEVVQSNDTYNAINIFNLRRLVASQYGGNTYTARQNSIYISTNSYINFAETSSAANVTYTYGGDIYLGLLDYPQTFTFQANMLSGEGSDEALRRYFGAYIPFETSINTTLFNGDMIHRTYTTENYVDSHLLLEPTQRGSYHTQDRPYYVYNAVYSSQTGAKQFVPPSIYSEDNLTVNNRIYTSQAKINNEILDNWTVFRVADYLDVDNQYGQVTNMLNFKDRLFYWQDTALGVAAVNERALIQDNNVGQLTLGTGGILARYDYITTTNGSSIINDRSIVTSDNTLYWYDYDKNEICSFEGGAVQALSKIKNVQSYLNEMYTSKRDVTLSLFDKKYNEVWFKFYDKSLIFSEQMGSFTSFYTFNPDWTLQFSDKIVAIKDNELYRVNSLDTDSMGSVNKDAKITLVVNQNPLYTKVFDNVRLQGEFTDANNQPLTTANIGTILFSTKDQQSLEQNIVFDYREDTYRFPVPRQNTNSDTTTYQPRLRGKYMICNYNFTVNGEQTFRIPFITTTYRQSLL